MRKFRGLALTMVVLIGSFVFVGCGSDKNTPEAVADKFMDICFKGDLTNEKQRKDMKEILDPNLTDEEKNEVIEEYDMNSMLDNMFTNREKEEMKQFGLDSKMEELMVAMKKSMKVERGETNIDGNIAEVKYKGTLPKVNEEKLEKELEVKTGKIQLEIISGKLSMEEGLKKVMAESIDLYINAIKNPTDFDTEEGTLELEKIDGKWYVTYISI